MTKKMLIDATHAEETRVVVVDGTKVEEFDFETVNKRQLAGNIYLAKVTRVEPSLQAAFVDYGGNRHGFLAFSEIHPDYYQIPVTDREALLAEEREHARAMDEEETTERPRRSRKRGSNNGSSKAAVAQDADSVVTGEISGMDVVDLGEDDGADSLFDTASAPQSLPAPDDVLQSESEPAPIGAETADSETSPEVGDDSAENTPSDDRDAEPESATRDYHSVDHASDLDDEIESIADEDVSEEISRPRKPRHRRYKIQEVVKVRQIMLVQVVKEERGNKGAALTTYLSLAGRYCVLMPNTARGGGISRKITNAVDRKKLKEIAGEIEVPEGAGLIIRTAGSQRTKTEIKRDYEYLQRLWDQIRDLTLKSIAPAPIYEEGTLIKRVIRDLYNRDIEEVLVEGADGYRVAKDFMRMIMPSHAKNVKHYTEQMPLFARYGVESFLASMFNPVVQLKSGGYIVIGITEALVAIDVNSGRATKEGSIEETALKTNVEAAEEVARQLRLRDLAGLIVIDFIDMEERRNNATVEKRLKDKLKTDRARIQVGRISGFGLLEMSRQRLRPGMLEASTAPCPHCHGTGLIRSDDSLALSILRQLEEEGTRKRSKEVLLKAPVNILNFLMNQKREHIAGIEARYGMAVRVEADPALVSPDFTIEKFKVATRVVVEQNLNVVSLDASGMSDVDDADEIEDDLIEDEASDAIDDTDAGTRSDADGGDGSGRKKRRRRRRRKPGSANGGSDGAGDDAEQAESDVVSAEDAVAEPQPQADSPKAEGVASDEAAEKPAPRRRTRTRKPKAAVDADAVVVADAPEEAAPSAPEAEVAAPDKAPDAAAEPVAEKPKRKPATRTRKPKVVAAPVAEDTVVAEGAAPATEPTPVAQELAPAPLAVEEAPVVAPAVIATPEPAAAQPDQAAVPEELT
ncbi:MAG: Rne/Rng family ribonuclease, partial [Paracoccaceae bacterium]|nr:Rne/Rng family ribonuclease [Paracoccaceae bacterium]